MLRSNVLGAGVASHLSLMLLMCLTALPWATAESCDDNPDFEDEYGFLCLDWQGYGPCSDKQGEEGWETDRDFTVTYSAEEMETVRKNCPAACELCGESEGLDWFLVVVIVASVVGCLAFCGYWAFRIGVAMQQDKNAAKVWEHFAGKGSKPSPAAPASHVQKIVGYARPLQDDQDEQQLTLTSAASTGATMQVTIPPNSAPGTFIQVQAPDGGPLVSIQVSPYAVPGTQILVPIPAARVLVLPGPD